MITNKVNFYNSFLSILICFLPFALITGPFLTDLTVVLSSLFFLFLVFIKKEFYYFKHPIFIFFCIWCCYLIIISLTSEKPILSLESSLFYFRFGIFALSIFYILNNNSNFIKNFSLCLLSVFIFVLIDAYFQFLLGFNILGFQYSGNRISGIFKDELILGSFISRLLPLIFALISFNYFNSKIMFFISMIILIASDILIFLSGERTAFFYLFLSTFIIILLVNKWNKLRLYTTIFSILFIFIITLTNENVKNRMINYTLEQTNIFGEKINLFSIQHEVLYISAYRIFKDNKIFGVGPKMFREICKKEKYRVTSDLDGTIDGCQTSPHNIYMQLLAETGIIGSIPVFVGLIYVLYNFFMQSISIIFKRTKYLSDFQVCLYCCLLITLWPLVPVGNFFNNYINSIYYLPIGFLIYSYSSEFNYRK